MKEGSFNFSDPIELMSTEVKRLSFKEKDETKRIAFVSDVVEMRMRHFVKGVGYRRCLANMGWCPGCVAADQTSKFHVKDFKPVAQTFAANVVVFDTDETGEVRKPLKADVVVFMFGPDKFQALRKIKNMYGTLVGIDISVTCTDPAFQKLQIMAFPKETSQSAKPNVLDAIRKKVATKGFDLTKVIAKEVTPFQMIDDYKLNPAMKRLPECIDIMNMIQQSEADGGGEFAEDELIQDEADLMEEQVPAPKATAKPKLTPQAAAKARPVAKPTPPPVEEDLGDDFQDEAAEVNEDDILDQI